MKYPAPVYELFRSQMFLVRGKGRKVSDGLLSGWVGACKIPCFLKTSKQNASFGLLSKALL